MSGKSDDPGSGPKETSLAERTSASGKPHNRVGLLVEDNLPDVLIIQEAIEEYGLPIELHVAADGDEAFQFIERVDLDPQAPCPRFLLLDLNLPKRSGKEVLKRVRQSERCGNIPVLIVTSSNLTSDREELAALGATRYFRKPSNYAQFLKIGEVLKEVLGRTTN